MEHKKQLLNQEGGKTNQRVKAVCSDDDAELRFQEHINPFGELLRLCDWDRQKVANLYNYQDKWH